MDEMLAPELQAQSLTAVDHLLLRLIRRDWDPLPWTPATIGPEVDWTAMVQSALHHGVAGLLCRSLRGLPAGEVPEDILAAAGTYLEHADVQGLVLVAQSVQYSRRPGGRRYSCPAVQGSGARRARARKSNDEAKPGYRRPRAQAGHGPCRRGIGPPRVRLAECLPLGSRWRATRRYGQAILFATGEPRWSRIGRLCHVPWPWISTRTVCGAAPAHLASPVVSCARSSLEDALLTACLHGSKEKWWRLLWVADVAALIRRHPALDWTALMERAETSGVRRMILLGLALAQDLFSSVAPSRSYPPRSSRTQRTSGWCDRAKAICSGRGVPSARCIVCRAITCSRESASATVFAMCGGR